MESIKRVVKCNRPDKFCFYPIGDCHLGLIHADEELLEEKVKEIASNPNALWLGMGDMADCIVPSDFARWEGRTLASWIRGQEDNIGPAQL